MATEPGVLINPDELLEFLRPRLEDPQIAWSIGTHGTSAEFMWERNEALDHRGTQDSHVLISDKGAMRVQPRGPVTMVDYETLSADGATRHSNMAFCLPTLPHAVKVITSLGEDTDAIRDEDQQSKFFDLGIGAGLVSLCVRTGDAELIAVLEEVVGVSLLSGDATRVMPLIMEKQPQRIMISPLGRIEVYQGIPPKEGKSPEGPHTHVFPAAIAKGLLHSGDIPIPEGLQSALSMHPRLGLSPNIAHNPPLV